ncbi:hypothetical protein BDR26DRAFT_919424 [Obelidium mucronatum]|nr:hypothetical protein BDR26DRAFT_919424 [Obelidium mucronatum]
MISRRKSTYRPSNRKIYVNQEPPNLSNGDVTLLQNFPSNLISTSKYTILTFLPKNLFEQFRRVANLFFLTLAILQFFPDYMTIDPWVAALPFIVIVLMTAIKDGVEDMRRHSSDRQINGQITRTLNFVNTNARFNQKRAVSNSKKVDAGICWNETTWGNVTVGDIILLRNDEPIPADILILNTSEPDGLCYVETKNLDGETNLKIRNGLLETAQVGKDNIEKLLGYCFRIESEIPNPNLYTYTGTAVFQANAAVDEKSKNVTMDEFDPNEEIKFNQVKVPLNINSILLRGCILRNTEWVVGLSLFTGKDTKICLNSGGTPSKQSKIEKTMNPQVLINLVILVILCLANCISSPLWESSHQPSDPSERIVWLASSYSTMPSLKSWIWIGFVSFWTSLIAFQNIVPISLYLTVEMVKTIQSYFIYNDAQMYYEPLNQPCVPKSWNLSDDLGQIDYIFSDKTGTLTRNIMQFKKCSINGSVYGQGEHLEVIATRKSVALKASLSLTAIARKNGTLKNEPSPLSKEPLPQVSVTSPSKGKVSFLTLRNQPRKIGPGKIDPISESDEFKDGSNDSDLNGGKRIKSLDDDLKFSDPQLTKELGNMNHPQYAPLRDFFTCLAVCHSVLISKNDDDKPESFKYNAQSPDEAALVQAARDIGFVFKARSSTGLTVDVLGEDEQTELLNVIEFNSTRKRMSVIVRRPAGEIVLYCKGADSVIYDRLAPGQDMMKTITSEHLEEFAEEGLRTLCIAYSLLPAAVYSKWAEEYNVAATALEDREAKMDAVAEKIENNLILMGATAIEDKLQEGVPECIKTLLSAGIKMWVLTGDKMETAINIGLSCNLLRKEMNLILIRGAAEDSPDEAAETRKQLSEALHRFFRVGEAPEEAASPRSRRFYKDIAQNNQNEPYALIIDGAALRYALQSDQKALLLELGTRCAAVICCRVSPLQKAQVVELVKTSIQCMCLAIGDGANDVSMIQAAHIGVGIAGEEGLQAVMASDYAVAQFKYLTRLLLVHGHWSYIRTAEMILNFFFKNIVWVFVLFWYQIYCGFSSQMIYDMTYMIFYNLVLTSLPVVFIGIFDMDIGQEFTLLAPPLYKIEIPAFSYRRFTIYMVDACYQSLAFFFITLGACGGDTIDLTGRTWGVDDLGVMLAICGVLHANLFVIISMNSWTWIVALLMTSVMAILIIFSLVYAMASSSLVPGLLWIMFPRASFWLAVGLQVIVCSLPRIVGLYCYRMFYPTNIHIMQEISKTHKGAVSPELRRVSMWLTEKKKISSRRGSVVSQLYDATSPIPSSETDSTAAESPLKREDTVTEPSVTPSAAISAVDAAPTEATQPIITPVSDTGTLPKPKPFPLQVDTRVVQSEYSMPLHDSVGALTVGTAGSTNTMGMYYLTAELRTPFSPMKSPSLGDQDDGKGGLTVMRTGQMLRNRGYSFSQSPGARDIIMGRRRVGGMDDISSPLANVLERSSTVQVSPTRVASPERKDKPIVRNNTTY